MDFSSGGRFDLGGETGICGSDAVNRVKVGAFFTMVALGTDPEFGRRRDRPGGDLTVSSRGLRFRFDGNNNRRFYPTRCSRFADRLQAVYANPLLGANKASGGYNSGGMRPIGRFLC